MNLVHETNVSVQAKQSNMLTKRLTKEKLTKPIKEDYPYSKLGVGVAEAEAEAEDEGDREAQTGVLEAGHELELEGIAPLPKGCEPKGLDPKGLDPNGLDPKGFDPKGFDPKGPLDGVGPAKAELEDPEAGWFGEPGWGGRPPLGPP